MKASRGKRVAMCVVVVGLGVVGVAGWLGWSHLRFWWLFEPLGRNEQGYPEFRHRQTGVIFVRVPGGTFWMGAQREDKNAPNYDPAPRSDERPVHQVELSPFLIDKYEVSQGEWVQVMGSNPSDVKGPDLPVADVSWNDCQEFCRKTGLRLPTEAQWEYACRAGADRSRGETVRIGDVAWCYSNSGERTHPVGEKDANAFGLHDMHGNVFEWCEDLYDAEYYGKPEASEKDPLCTSGPGLRVSRGGGWYEPETGCRSARRLGFERPSRSIGFRAAYWPLP